jgi:hypothetical protein
MKGLAIKVAKNLANLILAAVLLLTLVYTQVVIAQPLSASISAPFNPCAFTR